MDIASVIREGRRKKSMSQRVLAAKLKVSASAVAQWETDATMPSIAHRIDLAEILGLPFSSLLPEADVSEITLNNPQTIILVRKFETLPPPIRESILMQVVATADALNPGTETDAVKK